MTPDLPAWYTRRQRERGVVPLWLCQPSLGGAVLKSGGLKVVVAAAAALYALYAEWMIVSLSPASAEDRFAPLHALCVLCPLSSPVLPALLQEEPYLWADLALDCAIATATALHGWMDGWVDACSRWMCFACSCVLSLCPVCCYAVGLERSKALK